MSSFHNIAKAIYHNLPFPSIVKEKSKFIVFSLIPAWVPPSSTIPPTIGELPMDRKSKLLIRISAISDHDGLEIGPLARPIVSKIESNGRIQYVDIANAETLREYYKNSPDVPNLGVC